MTTQTEIDAAHDTLSLINDTRTAIKAQRNDGLIGPVEYARRMHQADVDQREAEVIIADSPAVRDAEARVARAAFTVCNPRREIAAPPPWQKLRGHVASEHHERKAQCQNPRSASVKSTPPCKPSIVSIQGF
jgi:hypothetical protein